MFKSSKSLAIVLSLLGGLALADLASASSQPLIAEYGSENLQKDRVAEGGADRLQELRERVAEGGADRLQELRERSARSVLVAENRPEFGSKYQRY